ncbi:MAG: extracellular solute-binding protein [Chloroflexi bacterium]|nr:extracellular solute-binding protein [Chloroflexota bacterium]
MKKLPLAATVFSVVLLLAAACSPTPAPVPAPATPQPQAAPRQPTQAVSPADAAWQKVIEAARKEGKVTLYSFNFTGDIGVAIARAFKERYGITVDIVTGRGAEFLERLKVEYRIGQVMADFTEGSQTHMINIKRAGQSVSVADLPAFQEGNVWEMDPFVLDPERHVISYTYSVRSPFVHTDLVKPADEPRSWKDLLDPRWKGKMVIGDPVLSSTPYLNFIPLLNQKALDVEYMRALGRQEMRFVTGDRQVGEVLSRKEMPMTPVGTSLVIADFAREGVPVKPLDMAEGLVVGTVGAVVLAKSPHPNAGKLFMNWLMSAEGQNVVSQAKATPPIRKGVPDGSPPSVRVKAKKFIPTSTEDAEDAATKFSDKFLVPLWKK